MYLEANHDKAVLEDTLPPQRRLTTPASAVHVGVKRLKARLDNTLGLDCSAFTTRRSQDMEMI